MHISTNEHGTVYMNGEIIGYVRDGSNGACGNEACLAAIAKGDKWHAIPPMGAGTLPHYHYYWRESAVAVLVAAATDWVGDHAPECEAVSSRKDLLADMTADPGNPYLIGAWFEYFNGGDQESELCDCGRFH